MGRMSFKSKGNDSKIRSTLSNSSATFRKLDSTVSDQITVINVYIKIYSLRIIKLGVDKATTVAELVQFISRYLKIRTKICHLILEKDELVGTDEEMMSPKVTMKQLQQTVNNRYANIDTGFICPAPIHLRLLISKYYQESQRKFMTTWSETQRLIICTMFFDKFIENSFTLIERDTDNYHEIVTIAGLFAREFLGVYDCQKHAGKSVYYLKFIPDLLDAKKKNEIKLVSIRNGKIVLRAEKRFLAGFLMPLLVNLLANVLYKDDKESFRTNCEKKIQIRHKNNYLTDFIHFRCSVQ
ncbi:MAG: hypothetical protein MHMPM18_000224 [Marteilia pararefringens]